jgi:ISXO2-like transposase domain
VLGNVSGESRLHTDESRLYTGAEAFFNAHETVNHSAKEYARGDVNTNSVEGFFSVFKRGMRGVYQHCSEKHLHRYLAEFEFRHNHRIARVAGLRSAAGQYAAGTLFYIYKSLNTDAPTGKSLAQEFDGHVAESGRTTIRQRGQELMQRCPVHRARQRKKCGKPSWKMSTWRLRAHPHRTRELVAFAVECMPEPAGLQAFEETFSRASLANRLADFSRSSTDSPPQVQWHQSAGPSDTGRCRALSRVGSGGCHRFFGRATYSFHSKGVTASGVPLPEAAAERLGILTTRIVW